jgi:enoyl-CoA hydratase
MDIMGLHTGIRAGSELCALGTHQKSMHEFLAKMREQGLTQALQQRDAPFGDYRVKEARRAKPAKRAKAARKRSPRART